VSRRQYPSDMASDGNHLGYIIRGSRSELIDVKFYWQSDVHDGQQMGACMEEEGVLLDDAGAT
jgi:hypothetical protein